MVGIPPRPSVPPEQSGGGQIPSNVFHKIGSRPVVKTHQYKNSRACENSCIGAFV